MSQKVSLPQIHSMWIPFGFITVGTSQALWLASRMVTPDLAQVLQRGSFLFLLGGLLTVLLVPVLLVVDLGRASRIMGQAVKLGRTGEYLVSDGTRQSQELEPLPQTSLAWSRALQELTGLLRDHGELTGELLDHMPVGVVLLDPQAQVLTANSRFRRMFNATGESIRGKHVQDILPASFREQWSPRSLFSVNWYGKETTEVRDQSSGRLYRTSVVRVLSGGQMKGVLALIVEDCVEHAEVETGSEEFKLLYGGMLEGVPEPLILVGADGVLRRMNRLAAELLGFDPEMAHGTTLLQVLAAAPDGSANRRLDAYFLSSDWRLHGSLVEASFKRNDGSEFLAEVKLGEWNQGKDRLFFLRLRDIFEEKQQGLLTRESLEALEMMSTCQPSNVVLQRLARIVEHQLPGSVCILMVRRDNRLFPSCAIGVPPEILRSLEGLEMNSSDAPCVVAASEARLVTVPDIALSPMREDIRNAALGQKLRACWSAPMFSRDGLVAGAITIYRKDSSGPDRWQARVLEAACHLAALCIEQQHLEGEMAYRALHDPLTGLPNQQPFEDRVRLAVAGAKRHGRLLGVMSMDLDGFQSVNDSLGPQVGDELLRKLATRLRNSLRETDILARWGGDEFRFGLLELRDRRDAETVAGRLLEALKSPVEIDGRSITASATVGLSLYPDDGQDAAALLLSADNAMYSAKRRQPNRLRGRFLDGMGLPQRNSEMKN
jgi:diguanylate cyclase (GGDEF)-like protein/PAS domain S-box-containing protein